MSSSVSGIGEAGWNAWARRTSCTQFIELPSVRCRTSITRWAVGAARVFALYPDTCRRFDKGLGARHNLHELANFSACGAARVAEELSAAPSGCGAKSPAEEGEQSDGWLPASSRGKLVSSRRGRYWAIQLRGRVRRTFHPMDRRFRPAGPCPVRTRLLLPPCARRVAGTRWNALAPHRWQRPQKEVWASRLEWAAIRRRWR